jgi:hypothetical protein
VHPMRTQQDAIGALLGAAIGTAVTNKREGAIVRAGIGLRIAALLASHLQELPLPA